MKKKKKKHQDLVHGSLYLLDCKTVLVLQFNMAAVKRSDTVLFSLLMLDNLTFIRLIF